MATSSAPDAAKITEINDETQNAPKEEAIEMSILIPFIEQTQASGALSLSDAYIVNSAIKYLQGESDEDKQEFLKQIPEQQQKIPLRQLASNVLVTTIMRGQAKGAFSLPDAAKLAKTLKMVKE